MTEAVAKKRGVIVGAQFGADEVAAIDFVAAQQDPSKPMRSRALRELVRLGYPVYRERFEQKRREMAHKMAPPSLGPPPHEMAATEEG